MNSTYIKYWLSLLYRSAVSGVVLEDVVYGCVCTQDAFGLGVVKAMQTTPLNTMASSQPTASLSTSPPSALGATCVRWRYRNDLLQNRMKTKLGKKSKVTFYLSFPSELTICYWDGRSLSLFAGMPQNA